MRTDLELARDHARAMAALTEPVTRQATSVGPGGVLTRGPVVVHPVPSDAERELWRQIADEIDTHLNPPDDEDPALDLEETP